MCSDISRFFKKNILFVKNKIIIEILHKMRIRKRRFFLLQVSSDVTLVVGSEYTVCVIIHCTNCTTCNRFTYRKAAAISY